MFNGKKINELESNINSLQYELEILREAHQTDIRLLRQQLVKLLEKKNIIIK